jgi:hypothetical protein
MTLISHKRGTLETTSHIFRSIVNELLTFKLARQNWPDIGHGYARRIVQILSQEALELQEFLVFWIVKPRLDGDAIVDLVAKGMRRVVDQDGLRQVTAKDVEILQEVALDG